MQIRTAAIASSKIWLVWCLVVATGPVGAQAPAAKNVGRFENRVFHDDQGDHKYTVFLPAGYQTGKKYPTILFLHGAGERGSDGQRPLTVGLAPYIKAKAATFPFIAVFPQCEDMEGQLLTNWEAKTADGQRALKILDEVQAKDGADLQRTALVGWSMGGYGAWSLGASAAGRWSAVVPLSGGTDGETLTALKETPVWVFHGAKDKLVPVTESQKAVEALRAAGGKVAYTEFPTLGHDVFDATFGNDGLYRWLLDPKNAKAELVAQPTRSTPAVAPAPFVPAVEIPQAVGIRLGNDALHSLAYAAPQLVPPSMLTGTLGDMYDSTSAAGRDFSIRFYGLSYRGQLDRVAVQGLGPDLLRIQLGVRNLGLNIGGTSISGARHAAQTGPITISVGYAYPVWLTLDVAPTVEKRNLRLRLRNIGFQIPPDNFSVSQPAGVSVQGFGMTQDRVVDALTSGLYGARGRIENEVRSVAPRIVQQLEERLNLAVDVGPMMGGLWPLPVYQPQMRAWPESVSVDKNGMMLVMGLTAAQPDPYAASKPLRTAESAGVSTQTLPADKALGVALAPQILAPMTQLLIDENLALINVLDIPDKALAKLADRGELAAIIPDLARYGDSLQTRTVLRMKAPLETNGSAETLEFRLPKLLLSVSINTNLAEPKWKPCAEFDMQLQQQVQPSLEKPTFSRREVELGWKPDPVISGTGKFAEGYAAETREIHADKFVELFREGWAKWTQGNGDSTADVQDVALGTIRLRMNDLRWSKPVIVAGFQPAGVKITNLSNEPFTYETKGPFSGWSSPFTLKPGDSHDFAIPFPLTYRRQSGTIREVYTLVAGSHSEFRVPLTGGAPRLFQARTP